MTHRKREEIAAYQIKDVSQLWFEQLSDERPLIDGPVD